MADILIADNGTMVAVLPEIESRQNMTMTAPLQTFLQEYTNAAGGQPLPPASLFFVNPHTHQTNALKARDALALYRLLDLCKDYLDQIVYEELERDSEEFDDNDTESEL